MNVLILSCGTRCRLVEFFKRAVSLSSRGRVICVDFSKYAPALYFADAYSLVPPYADASYVDALLEICRKEDVRGILPLQEDELEIVAANINKFSQVGATVVVSGLEALKICRDKFLMMQYLEQAGVNVIRSFKGRHAVRKALLQGALKLPVFVKPTRGCGSIGACRVDDMVLLEYLLGNKGDELVVQNYESGSEFGVDAYVDLITKELVACFIKRKIRMRAGETEKSISVINDQIGNLVCRAVQSLNLVGPIDIDIFERSGRFYISEINPRFGGGYPHAWHCGVDFPAMMVRNLSGMSNPRELFHYCEGVVMMKYPAECVEPLKSLEFK